MLFVASAGAILYALDSAELIDIERLANVVTVLVPAVAVYTLFDDRLLEWIVRVVREVVARIKATAGRPQRSNAGLQPASAAPLEEVPIPTAAEDFASTPPALDPGAHSGARVYSWRKPTLFDWVLVGLLPIFLILSVPVFGARIWEMMSGPPSPAQRGVTPSEQAVVAPPTTPKPETSQAKPDTKGHTVMIARGDTCWAIAERCTGSAVNYFELGPPLNEIAINPATGTCRIREGRELKLPEAWPAYCADR